ncbi:hypothetical protein FBU30_009641 [Linnemannia zychae]|nr:hypothetical protein FBU30_009641 [Linnemannia zychae]
MKITYTALFPLPPDRKSLTPSSIAHSVDMKSRHLITTVDVSVEVDLPFTVTDVPPTIIGVSDNIKYGHDKNPFQQKKCFRCPLYGHLRSVHLMYQEDPNNAHRRESMLHQFISLHDLSVSLYGDLILPNMPLIPIPKQPSCTEYVFDEDYNADFVKRGSGFKREYLQRAQIQNIQIVALELDMKILLQLQEMLEIYNPFYKLYRSIRENENGINEILQYTIIITDVDFKGRKLRQYDVPTITKLAGLIPGGPSINYRDIIMMHREPKEDKKYLRINETNTIYDGEQREQAQQNFDLSFGDQMDTCTRSLDVAGFELGVESTSQSDQQQVSLSKVQMPFKFSPNDYLAERFSLHKDIDEVEDGIHACDSYIPEEEDPPATLGFVSMREFYAYQFQSRPISDSDPRCYFWLFKRLIQQYIVDQYAKIESDRLHYNSIHQDDLSLSIIKGSPMPSQHMTASNTCHPLTNLNH